MKRFLKSSTALAVSVSLVIIHVPVPNLAFAKEPSGAAVLAIHRDGASRLLNRLDELEKQLAEFKEAARKQEKLVERLMNQIDDQQTALDAAEASVVTLSQTLASVGALGKNTADLVEEAEKVLPKASSEMKPLVEQALKMVKTGDWANGLEQEKILDEMHKARDATLAVREEFKQRRDKLSRYLDSACAGSQINAHTAQQLASLIGGDVPDTWNPDLAATAARNGILLPSCFQEDTENGRTIKDDVYQYIADQQASQQMAMAVNSMMMAAMSTGNPYVIAAVLGFMALMAIFGDNGGGGGNGNGNGNNGTSTGQTQTGDTEHGLEGQGGQDLDSSKGVPNDRPPQGVDLGRAPRNAYGNVAPGVDTWVEVNNQAITFTDKKSGTRWSVNWPPRFPDSNVRIPAFTKDVKILSASATERQFSVQMMIPPCESAETLEIGAEPNNPGDLILLRMPTECVFGE